ncbi:hypothetical protein OPT61_g10276 [Boeremia exigua]|uniref:Uncharacterized protein n=1 Tax=Boeremia exigua TaxID=749465 RepID=A0ACC2HQN5_9PLEO|nr:hypothetical protein OPT61_g10276 [Boeremia exigua]
MLHLPQEIIHHICEYLSTKDLEQTLTVCRTFRYATERASGTYAKFSLTKVDLEAFLKLCNSRRFAYLRHVNFTTTLPCQEVIGQECPALITDLEIWIAQWMEKNDRVAREENDARLRAQAAGGVSNSGPTRGPYEAYGRRYRCRETAEELRTNDEDFTEQIQSLFNTLQVLERKLGIGYFHLNIYVPERENHGSKIDLRVLGDLSVKLPQLTTLACELGHHEWTSYIAEFAFDLRYYPYARRRHSRDFAGPRRDTRHNFARLLLTAALPSSLACVQLNFLTPLQSSVTAPQDEQLPDLVTPCTHDPFSSSLRVMSYRLRRMELKGVFDRTLFWPADDSTPTWPSLEILKVYFHIATPSGRWYFYGQNGESRDDAGAEVTDASYPPMANTVEDNALDHFLSTRVTRVRPSHFRILPNAEVLTPLLAAFAQAAVHMHKLREVALWTSFCVDGVAVLDQEVQLMELHYGYDVQVVRWGVAFLAPCATGPRDCILPNQHTSPVRKLLW